MKLIEKCSRVIFNRLNSTRYWNWSMSVHCRRLKWLLVGRHSQASWNGCARIVMSRELMLSDSMSQAHNILAERNFRALISRQVSEYNGTTCQVCQPTYTTVSIANWRYVLHFKQKAYRPLYITGVIFDESLLQETTHREPTEQKQYR